MSDTQHDVSGTPTWVEAFSPDIDGTVAFYTGLFGWDAEDTGADFGHYRSFHVDGLRVAGGMANNQPGAPSHWMVYLGTDDVERTAEAARQHGGQVVVDPMTVGDLGRMTVVGDGAGGAGVGAWQPGTHTGIGRLGEVDAPAWFELHTARYADALAFYRDVFGWRTHVLSDSDDFRYSTLSEGDDARAGIMEAESGSAQEPVPMWHVYFRVADTDAAVARARALGASVVHEAADTPFGRIACLADPQGLLFRLVAGQDG